MFKALGFLIKLTLLSVTILVIGNRVSWDGKTLSDHVRAQVTRAERSDAGAYLMDRHPPDHRRCPIGL